MKVFLQTKDESIIINGDITVRVLEIKGDEVVLGIDAPEWLTIDERPEFQAQAAGQFAPLRKGLISGLYYLLARLSRGLS